MAFTSKGISESKTIKRSNKIDKMDSATMKMARLCTDSLVGISPYVIYTFVKISYIYNSILLANKNNLDKIDTKVCKVIFQKVLRSKSNSISSKVVHNIKALFKIKPIGHKTRLDAI